VQDFGGLPDHMQIMVAGTVVVIASAYGVIKFIKPFIDHLTPKGPAAGQSTDTVVISAAFADRQTMKDFTESVDKLRECQAESNIINKMLLDAINRLIHKP
jgi:hypothetical protein